MAQKNERGQTQLSLTWFIPGSCFDSRRCFIPGKPDELDIQRYVVEVAAYRLGCNYDGQLAGSKSCGAVIPPLGKGQIYMGYGSGSSRNLVPGRIQPVVADYNHRSRSCLSISILLVIRTMGNYSVCQNELFTCYNYPT